MTVAEFRERMAALGPMPATTPPRHTWERHRYEMQKHSRDDDPRDFLQWSTVQGTMFVGNAPYVRDEFDALANDGIIPWAKAFGEHGFGNPDRLPYWPATSGNLVHNAYHLLRFREATGVTMDMVGDVVEFGGGYGALTMLAQRLGHGGVWYVVDFPEMLLLQQFYLAHVGADMARVAFLPRLEKPGGCGLVVGMWSLSEAPIETREAFISKMVGDCYLFAYQPEWMGVNNINWFWSLRERNPDVEWTTGVAARGSIYLFGRRT